MLKCFFTQFPEPGNHVDKRGHPLVEWLWQVGFEIMSECEQVVSQEHAVVVMNSSKLRELEQVFPEGGSRETGNSISCNKQFGLCCVYDDKHNLLVICGYNVTEQLENVLYGEE